MNGFDSSDGVIIKAYKINPVNKIRFSGSYLGAAAHTGIMSRL